MFVSVDRGIYKLLILHVLKLKISSLCFFTDIFCLFQSKAAKKLSLNSLKTRKHWSLGCLIWLERGGPLFFVFLLFSFPPIFLMGLQSSNKSMFEITVIRWALIAGRIPGRTAEDIEKYWNSRYSTSEWILGKKIWWFSLQKQGFIGELEEDYRWLGIWKISTFSSIPLRREDLLFMLLLCLIFQVSLFVYLTSWFHVGEKKWLIKLECIKFFLYFLFVSMEMAPALNLFFCCITHQHADPLTPCDWLA